MPSAMAEVSVGTLQAFADAWSRHDVDALMSFIRKAARRRPYLLCGAVPAGEDQPGDDGAALGRLGVCRRGVHAR
jgi:hypothetical protein